MSNGITGYLQLVVDGLESRELIVRRLKRPIERQRLDLIDIFEAKS